MAAGGGPVHQRVEPAPVAAPVEGPRRLQPAALLGELQERRVQGRVGGVQVGMQPSETLVPE